VVQPYTWFILYKLFDLRWVGFMWEVCPKLFYTRALNFVCYKFMLWNVEFIWYMFCVTVLACLCVVHVGCGLSTFAWHLSDNTRDACQRLMLSNPLGIELRRTSPYGTQVAGLRMGTTLDVGSSGEAENGHQPRFLWEITLFPRWMLISGIVLIILWLGLCWDSKCFCVGA